MENKLKTRDVAEKLGVHPRTVRHWIKYFSLNCESNKAGHYLIDNKNFEYLKFIRGQLRSGKNLDEIMLPGMRKHVTSDKLDERFNRLLMQIEQLDRKIQSKAGEVVEYQLLQHRREIDDITNLLKEFNERLKVIEEKLNEEGEKIITLHHHNEGEKEKKRRFASMFSF